MTLVPGLDRFLAVERQALRGESGAKSNSGQPLSLSQTETSTYQVSRVCPMTKQ